MPKTKTKTTDFNTFRVYVLHLTQKAMKCCKEQDYKKKPDDREEFWLPLSQIEIKHIHDLVPHPLYTIEVPTWIVEEKGM